MVLGGEEGLGVEEILAELSGGRGGARRRFGAPGGMVARGWAWRGSREGEGLLGEAWVLGESSGRGYL